MNPYDIVELDPFLETYSTNIVSTQNKNVLLDFLGLFLTLPEIRAEMWSHGKGNAQLNISPTSIHSLKINLPPLPEQKRIVEIIKSIDDVLGTTSSALSESKKLRTGLLSDLLSGKHEIPASYDKVIGAA